MLRLNDDLAVWLHRDAIDFRKNINGLAALVPLAHVPEGVRVLFRSSKVPGAVLVTGALMLAVYGIVGGNEAGWTSARTLTLLGVSAVLFAVFVAAKAAQVVLRIVDRAETMYGKLNELQVHAIEQMTLESPLDPQGWYAEQIARLDLYGHDPRYH